MTLDYAAVEARYRRREALRRELEACLAEIRALQRQRCRLERQVDDAWFVAFNGYAEDTPTTGGKDAMGQEVPVFPFSVYVEYHGWPAGMLTPSGGEFAAGAGANPGTFVAALAANLGTQLAPVPTTGG